MAIVSTHSPSMENQTAASSQQEVEEKGTTSIRTWFNGMNALSGVGIISVPYAMSQTGWLSLPILFFVASLCCYTGILLVRCVALNPQVKSYPDIGEVAFGAKGKVLVSVFLYVELYLVAVEFLILEGDNLEKMFPNGIENILGIKVGVKQGFIILTALIIWPTTWLRSLGILAYVSMGGVFASLLVMLSILWTGAFEGEGFHAKGVLWNSKGLPTTISMFIFCYCGHSVIPTLCISMKNRSQFKKVLLICFMLSTINYVTMAIFGYLMYGQHLESQITLNLPATKTSSKIAIYTTLINPLTKYALLITPIATCIEDRLQFLTTKRWIVVFVVRTMLVISTVVIALTVPFFGYVMAFIGSFLGVTVSILFPCMCYVKLNKFGNPESKVIVVIFGLGLLAGLVGTYNSVRGIVNQLRSS